MFKIYSEISQDLKKKWLELEAKSNIFPFQKLEWIEAYINNLSKEEEKFIFVCIFNSNKLIAIFPLSIIKVGFINLLCFIGYKFTDYCYPIIEKNYDLNQINLKEIFQELYKKNKFDCILIKNQKFNAFNNENIFFKYFESKYKYKEDLSYSININTEWKKFLGKKRERKIKFLQKNIYNKLANNLIFKINATNLTLDEKKEIVEFFISRKRDQLNRTKIFHYLNNSLF